MRLNSRSIEDDPVYLAVEEAILNGGRSREEPWSVAVGLGKLWSFENAERWRTAYGRCRVCHLWLAHGALADGRCPACRSHSRQIVLRTTDQGERPPG